MKLYHGTCNAFVPSILKEGLKSDPQNAFDFGNGWGDHPESLRELEGKPKYVFLTKHKDVATWFAMYRALYERTPVGQALQALEAPKQSGKVIPDAKPVLLTVELPESAITELSKDPLSNSGLRYPEVIPPNSIALHNLQLKPLNKFPYSTLMKI